MIDNHISDEDAQIYILDKSHSAVKITDHLQNCEFCRSKVLNYERMLMTIKSLDKPVFDYDIYDLLASQLVTNRKPKIVPLSKFELSLYIVVGLIAIAGITYFLPALFSNIPRLASYLVYVVTIALFVFQLFEYIKNHLNKIKSVEQIYTKPVIN